MEGSDAIRLEREPVIQTLKPKLVMGLADTLELQADKESFLVLCRRVEAVIRAWYQIQFEELLQLYALFDPANGGKKLASQNLSAAKIEELEQRFLDIFLHVIMIKSNFKLLTDAEYKIATSGHYLLNLPIAVDKSRLDNKLLSKFFEKKPYENSPSFINQYAIFRRGIGVDKSTGTFVNDKVDLLISRFWSKVLSVLSFGLLSKRSEEPSQTAARPQAHGDTSVERTRIQNMRIGLGNLLKTVTLQEPTFERMIVIYRKSTPKSAEATDHGIHIKHFKHVPMADMELVLPEKKNPGLTATDWMKFLVSAVIGFVAFAGTLETHPSDIWVALAILGGFLSYCAKIYFTFQANMVEYQRLITNAMYDKQLDSGKGTLLHLCDDVIQQEVKEVIIAYYVLMTQGKQSLQGLDELCEELLAEEFSENCNFEVDDAIQKLERLGIVSKDSLGRYVHNKRANEIIGVTTDEIVARAM